MGFFNKYPYTDMHELNLDWLISRMRQLEIEFNEFEVVNQITFSGAWDITDQYPAWTIVSDNNIGYVSIQPVPAGVLLTNSDYWRVVIDYTAQIAGLQARVVNLENTVGDNTSGLVKDVNDLQTDMNNVQYDVNLLKNHRYIFVSDSYGTVSDSWIDQMVSMLGLSAGDYYYTAVAGAGFQPPYNSYFIDYLQALEPSVDSPDTITDIVVVGGFNDRSTAKTPLAGAIQNFVNYCKTHFPNAKVWIGGAGWSFNMEFCRELRNGQYLDVYKYASVFGAYYLDGMDNIMHGKDKFIEEDQGGYTLILGYMYVHPNLGASKLIAACVISNIFGSCFRISDKTTVTVSLKSGIVCGGGGGATFNIVQYIEDDKIKVYIPIVNLGFTTPESATLGNTWIELGDVTSGFVAGASSADCIPEAFFVEGFIAGGSPATNKAVPIMLSIMNNKIYAKVYSNPDTISNIFITYGYAEFSNKMA